jgi:hypothetical protein
MIYAFACRHTYRKRWLNLRKENRDWLTEWEATLPQAPGENSEQEFPTIFEMARAALLCAGDLACKQPR